MTESNLKIPRGKLEKLAPDVYAYIQPATVFVSNAGLIVGKDSAVVVDSLTNQHMTQSFIDQIQKVTINPVRFLINTHAHGDHIYTNHLFSGASVICSKQCREDTKNMSSDEVATFKKMVPEMNFDGAKVTVQNVAFEKELSIYLDGREIRMVDLGAGHCKSDTYVFLPQEKVVFCGDLLVIGLPPQVIQGSLSQEILNLDILANLNADIYVPGHGVVTTRESVYEHRELLVQLREEARKCFYRGIDFEEAAKTIHLEKFEEWSNYPALILTVARAYSELRGEELACDLSHQINFHEKIINFIGLLRERGMYKW